MSSKKEPLVPCPYNKTHMVRRGRLPHHIVKCMKNYPDYKVCPYNAMHRVPASELQNHAERCLDAFVDRAWKENPTSSLTFTKTDYPDSNEEEWED